MGPLGEELAMTKWNPSPQQRLCRDLMHAWQPSTAYRIGIHYVRELVCLRCSSEKIQTLDLHGYIVRSEYLYQPGYLNPGGGRATREARAEMRTWNLENGSTRDA